MHHRARLAAAPAHRPAARVDVGGEGRRLHGKACGLGRLDHQQLLLGRDCSACSASAAIASCSSCCERVLDREDR